MLDLRIRKYCRKLKITYTRYADDMLFSITKDPNKSSKFESEQLKRVMGLVSTVLYDYGLGLNYSKTIKTKNQISLNGFLVSTELSLSRKKLSKLKKVLFIIESIDMNDELELLKRLNENSKSKIRLYFASIEKLHNYLAGFKSFLISWMPREDGKWKRHCQKTIYRIEKVLQKINR